MANKEDKDKLQVEENVGLTPLHDPPMGPTQPAPPITQAIVSDTVMPAPPISPTQEAQPQPSQEVSPSRPPADPVQIADPPRTHEAARQPSQDPGQPAPIWQPRDVIISPSKPPSAPVDTGFFSQSNAVLPQPVGFSPAPNATLPQPPDVVPGKPSVLPAPPEVFVSPTVPVPLQNVPIVPSVPATLPGPPVFVPQPNSTLPQPVDFKPQPNAVLPIPPAFVSQPNSTLPPMPAPPPLPKAILPPMPAPPPVPNAVLPPMPAPPPVPNAVLPPPLDFVPKVNAVLPPMPAPLPSIPAVVPPPPSFVPQPAANLPPPPAFASQPNAILPGPPNFKPQPNAVLPGPPNFVQPQAYAPNLTIEPSKDVLGKLSLVDAAVKESLRLLVPFGENGGGSPGSHAGDPTVLAKNLKRLGQQIGQVGLAQFSGLQFTLFAMNVNGKIWNPNTLFPAPGSTDWIPAAIDDFATHEVLVLAQATLGDGISAIEQNVKPLENDQINIYSTDNPYTQRNAGTFFSIEGLVDKATGKGFDVPSSRILVTDKVTKENKVDISSLYGGQPYGGKLISLSDPGAKFSVSLSPKLATDQGLPGNGSKLARAYFSSGIVPATIDSSVEDHGFLTTVIRRDDPSKVIDDDDAYVPLSFMDLRPMNGSNDVRTVYFRPFITNLTEDLSPEWNKQNFFGRTDAVATYMATGRTINIGFQVHAFAPEDLEVIYQKKNWLASMCYPSYDKDILFKSGPVIRLRVGDLLKTRGGFGLPGIIESLSFDYNDVVWELQKGNKVPMGFKVSISFLVLHEKPIGIGVDGQFGGIGRIDPGTGRWSPPSSNTNDDDTKNAPEIGDGINDFAGGTGNTANQYSDK